MQTIKIPLSGITRNTDDGVSVDGNCMELINAKVNNGSIEPVGQPIKIAQLEHEFKSIHRHELAGKYIGITIENNIYEISDDFKTTSILPANGVIGVEFVGFTVSLLTDSGIKYLLYKNDSYYYLGDLPDLPNINIETKTYIQENSTYVSYNTMPRYDSAEYDSKYKIWCDTCYGQLLKCLSDLNKKGYYSHSTSVRVAFRMYDGSYIKHSPIRLLKYKQNASWRRLTSDSYLFEESTDEWRVSCRNKDTWDEQLFSFYLVGIKPEFTIEQFDLSNWNDLIVSIDIFASKGYRQPFGYTKVLSTKENYAPDKDLSSPADEFIKDTGYYKIASISLDGVFNETEQDVSSDNIVFNDQVTDDTGTHHHITAKKSYSYNNRLHIFNTEQRHYNGYEMDYLGDYDSSGEPGYIEVYTFIRATTGESVVRKMVKFNKLPLLLPPFLMYPDSRAYKMVIKFLNESFSVLKAKEFELKQHKTLNLSYYTQNQHFCGYHDKSYYTFKIEDTSSWGGDISVVEQNIPEVDNTKLKVSELNNPFYFPPETTYQFQSEIIAIQSNTAALSQGQFGQHPLYVFTKTGVNAMTVGSGATVYAATTPVTRDVATSENVCAMDSFVCFISSRGVMLIQGSQTRCISEQIDGFLPSSMDSQLIRKIMDIPDMYKNISVVPFYEFIKNASIGYNYSEAEIIISNKLYQYSYVYNMNNSQWHKLSLSISSFVNTYPDTYAMTRKDAATIINNLNNRLFSVSKITAITRPIKIGTNTYKRVLQTALRGIVKKSLSDLYLRGEQMVFRGEPLMLFDNVSFYILGSNDTENFQLIGGKENVDDIRDLITKMNKSKAYKYFMVCLIGGVRSDVSINYVEMVVDETFANRLR